MTDPVALSPPDDVPRLRLSSVILAVAVAAFGTGFVHVRSAILEMLAALGSQFPPLTPWLADIPNLVCALGGLYAAAFLLMKDLWSSERAAMRIDAACGALLMIAFLTMLIGLFLPLASGHVLIGRG